MVLWPSTQVCADLRRQHNTPCGGGVWGKRARDGGARHDGALSSSRVLGAAHRVFRGSDGGAPLIKFLGSGGVAVHLKEPSRPCSNEPLTVHAWQSSGMH